jgi:hypothetical protein
VRAQAAVDAVQAMLRAPRVLQDVVGQAVMAGGERGADARGSQVMPRRLDEDPPGVPGTGLGDRAVRVGLAGLLARRDQSQPETGDVERCPRRCRNDL